MGRYLQKISLRPYSDSEIWTGWELEGQTDEIEGLLLADGMSAEELATFLESSFGAFQQELRQGKWSWSREDLLFAVNRLAHHGLIER